MLIEVLFAGEAMSRVTLAGSHGAHELILRTAVLLVDLAFVPQETAGIGEPLKFTALRVFASVGAGVFIHMFSA